jgi:hypothetical protein
MTTSKWLAISVACLLGASAQLRAEGSGTSSYFCVVEASGGVAYNANMKKWVGMTFNPDGKFVLRLRQLSRRSEKNALGNDEAVTDYNISLTEFGSGTDRTCEKIGSVDPTITVYGDRALYCADGATDYVFNITANRFLASDMRGYVFGKNESSEDYPSISAGTCTKIE